MRGVAKYPHDLNLPLDPQLLSAAVCMISSVSHVVVRRSLASVHHYPYHNLGSFKFSAILMWICWCASDHCPVSWLTCDQPSSCRTGGQTDDRWVHGQISNFKAPEPQIINPPPPCLTVGMKSSCWNSVRFAPKLDFIDLIFFTNNSTLALLVHRTLFQEFLSCQHDRLSLHILPLIVLSRTWTFNMLTEARWA